MPCHRNGRMKPHKCPKRLENQLLENIYENVFPQVSLGGLNIVSKGGLEYNTINNFFKT
jgi:hypothetical protein